MPRPRFKLIMAVAIYILIIFYLIMKKPPVLFRFSESDPLLLPRTILRSPPDGYCEGLDMLVVIHTKLNSPARRDFWRRTYGSSFISRNFKYKLLFSVGTSTTLSKREDVGIQRESDFHGDILQCDYTDSYRNLTVKQLAQLRFFYEHCDDQTVMMKIDDDVAWDIERVHEEAMKVRLQTDMEIRCAMWPKMTVNRNKSSKWYVTENEFSLDVYPDYCSGISYFLQHKAAEEMMKVAKNLRFFWIDDVFITGMLTEAAGVRIQDIEEKYALRHSLVNVNEMFALVGRAASESWFQKMNARLLKREKDLEEYGD